MQAFNAITWDVIVPSCTLDPIVLASRAISWSRKSMRFPTAALEILDQFEHLVSVAVEAHQLLGDVGPVRQHGDLLLQSRRVELGVDAGEQGL